MRTLGIVLACLVISGSASGGPRGTGAPAAARRKPIAKPARPRPQPQPKSKPPEPAPAPAPEPEPAPVPAEPRPAAAATRDARKTLEAVTLRKRPGEKQAVVAKLPAGTEVIVEAEEGRWLRVRAGKVSGYLARTTVTEPAGEPAAAPPAAAPDPGGASASAAPSPDEGRARTWSRARQADPDRAPGAELFVEVTADSDLRAEARPDAAAVARVARGARLAVLEVDESAGWLRARDDGGHAGWIGRDRVSNGSAAVAASSDAAPAQAQAAAPRRARSGDMAELGAPRAITLRADAAIGYRTFGMDFQSNGTDGLAGYLATSGAGAADLALELVARPAARWRVAADTRVQLSRLSPGLDYDGPSAPPGKIAFETFGVDAGVRAGRRAGRAFDLWLRAGGHYDAFLATDVENAGRLPRERLLGATAGARVEIAPPDSRVSAALWVDALVVGSRRQTPGLEDGADSSARAVWAGAALRIRIRPHLFALGAYDFGRATTRWSGMSVRLPGVTEASRTDQSQLVRIGLGTEL